MRARSAEEMRALKVVSLPEGVINVKEAAKLIGCTPAWARKLITTREELPYQKYGSKIGVKVTDVEAFLLVYQPRGSAGVRPKASPEKILSDALKTTQRTQMKLVRTFEVAKGEPLANGIADLQSASSNLTAAFEQWLAQAAKA